ncbi:MAG: hypothetical protein P4K98_06295 [Bryobacteraceae bacterium]|nr:hypothetical protein [Bryobacteraceae bacterium]
MPVSNGFTNEVGVIRWPSMRVIANGEIVVGAFQADISNNSHLGSDRFSLSIAASADPLHDLGWWADQDRVTVDIEVTLGSGFVKLIRGGVDTVEVDHGRSTVHLGGRDLAARLIDSRTQGIFANRTSSEIAMLVAGRHGLTADVQATTTPVGRYWQLGHDRLVLGGCARVTSEWDLLVTLAEWEGYDVWVEGAVLHFGLSDETGIAGIIRPEGCESLRLERSLVVANDVEVTVKSWHSRTAQGYSQTARSGVSPGGGESVQQYVYIVPNLMPEDALRLANRRLQDLTRHERVIVADMPGELSLLPRRKVLLQGTGTAFDGEYLIDSVDRRLDSDRGFSQRVHACTNPAAS